MSVEKLRQRWPMPSKPRPIVSIGAGGIVRDAHYPAYRKAGFHVLGLFDAQPDAARKTARMFGVERQFATLREAVSASSAGGVVFDVAVPADQILSILRALPDRSVVLIQKPMGRGLVEARRILDLCRRKSLVAAVNFQLRFSPNMLALAHAIERGDLGRICDVDVRVNTHMPWDLWSFLSGIPRMEILYHSVHYLDLIRSLIGDPHSVHCAAVAHPSLPSYADTRTSAILRYSRDLRCSLFTSHSHDHGPEHACSQILIEGTQASAFAQMGVNLDYPRGEVDELAFAARGKHWKKVALRGYWFPDAFMGTMSNLQRFAAGEDETLATSVEDAVRTMALVEALYTSSSRAGTRVPKIPTRHHR